MSRLATAYIGFLVAVAAAARLGYQPAEVTAGRLQQWQDLTTPGCFLAAVWLGSRRWLTGLRAMYGRAR